MIDPGSATIIAAGITASATIVTIIIRKTPKKPDAAQKMGTAVRKSMDENFGFSAEAIHSKAEVLNLDGDVKVTRGCKGIKLKPGFMMAHIPAVKVFVSTPGGSIKNGPNLITHKEFPKDISLVTSRKTATECIYQIQIPTILTSNEPPLDYEVETEFSKAVLMSRDAVDKAYTNDLFKRDYFSVDAEFPMDDVEIEITFPEGLAVTTFGTVFLLHSETLEDSEFQRVKKGFERTNRGARFEIHRPTVGFRYAIYWSMPK
jgi:hypothetical protein